VSVDAIFRLLVLISHRSGTLCEWRYGESLIMLEELAVNIEHVIECLPELEQTPQSCLYYTSNSTLFTTSNDDSDHEHIV